MKQITIRLVLIPIFTLLFMLPSCATSPKKIEQYKKTLNVKVVAHNFGYSMKSTSTNNQTVLQIVDIDGKRLRKIWDKKECDEIALRHMLLQCRKKHRFDNSSKFLIREAINTCVSESNLPDSVDTALPDATRYYVALTTYPITFSKSGVPISKSGSYFLGGVRLLSRIDTNSILINIDVGQCVDSSLKYGFLDSYSSREPPNSSTPCYIGYKSRSINGFLRRFDQCIANLGYTVEEVVARDKTNPFGGLRRSDN